MSDRIQIGDQWYVAATSARPEDNSQVLKHEQSFVLFDRFGDIQALGSSDEGLYHDDTRFLSHQELTVDGARPLHLGSNTKDDSSLLLIELMNPDMRSSGPQGEVDVPKGTLHIFRAKLLFQCRCYEHIRFTNYGLVHVCAHVGMTFAADFVDLFEVRGIKRARRGERLPAVVGAAEVALPYRGRDARLRRTRLCFDPRPARLSAAAAGFDIDLAPGQECHLYCTVVCEYEDEPGAEDDNGVVTSRLHYERALRRSNAERISTQQERCTIETSNPLVNLWIDRSLSDLAMLTTELPTGPYPYAGVPWYSTTFGRDGAITARECLWIDPSAAKGVLAFLASTQATVEDAERDCEPGKILHEARRSEMARTHEIPFGRYYGTADATPLFVALAGAYHRRTGDTAFIRSIWPNILHALEWIERYGDRDGDGFVEYARSSSEGLVQQGWKDSQDSIFHADGELAEAPIALCEIQAYVYEAKLMASDLARLMGDAILSQRLCAEAVALKSRFEAAFWCEHLNTYAIALDGAKRKCEVAASNAGHALWTGIASRACAERIAVGLTAPDFFSGWGIRTLAATQARYNPMSYHNGSVWPHDNALIAVGMARYGYTEAAVRILTGMFEASLHFNQHRLPELFCGFPRRQGEGPTLYPVACSPQAWAAAAVLALLQACLGIDLDLDKRALSLHSPRLPPFIDWIRIERLKLGEASVDVILNRYRNNVGIDILRRDGDIAIGVSV
jgi:glycogen debranching enzyme